MAGPIITCIVAVCFGAFCLSKTTLRRRVGFWRETARPFLLMLLASAMGMSIVMITPAGARWLDQREFHAASIAGGGLAQSARVRITPVQAKAPFIVMLVASSLAFAGVVAARGRGRRRPPAPTPPFFMPGDSDHRDTPSRPHRPPSAAETEKPANAPRPADASA